MSKPLFTCSRCKQPQRLSPPLSQRTSNNGGPMTTSEALQLFCHGGLCSKCFIEKRNEDSRELMQRIAAAQPKPMTYPLTADHVERYQALFK